MDAIEDTEIAIETYQNLHKFNGYNGGYLYIYGLLQALNIQQDAVNNLNISLFNEKIEYKDDYPELYQIREHRNNSIGHPTKRGVDASFHNIDRSSINNEGFTLASNFPKTGETSTFKKISIVESIKQQSTLVNQILLKVMSNLKADFENHKDKFKGQKLAAMVSNNHSYEFSKLYTHIFDDYPLVQMNFDHLKSSYEKIKNGIKERYFSINTLQGTKDTIEVLDYLFERLENKLIKNKIEDKMELRIFVDALNSNFDELIEMLDEIDSAFE